MRRRASGEPRKYAGVNEPITHQDTLNTHILPRQRTLHITHHKSDSPVQKPISVRLSGEYSMFFLHIHIFSMRGWCGRLAETCVYCALWR
ncbi:hypothetical protein E2C01_004574 [Portunus trituberculatus]|uniref:Uncharacterized protein n=1 Tax=Portunus trituberculatus TaxID=210409 RepID=A0A5B7CQW1_PORTR|nr:hypothetical protein [Portunus trituberculatus]